MAKRYVVQMTGCDDEVCVALKTADECISLEDCSDLYDMRFCVWECGGFGELIPIRIMGCWHNPADPLYIKGVRPDGSVAFDGYGTDH